MRDPGGLRCQGAYWLRHMPLSSEPQSFFTAARQEQLLGARLAPAARRSLGEADLPRAEGPAMDLVNPRPARTRRRACSGASHSARLRRGPSYGAAGPRSIGGEPSLWCAVPAGPSRAWRSCSSPRLARGAFSRESPAAALFSCRALVYSQHRRRARTGRWKAPVVPQICWW